MPGVRIANQKYGTLWVRRRYWGICGTCRAHTTHAIRVACNVITPVYVLEGLAGRLVYTAAQVQPKYLINSENFKPGYVTTSDRWDNYWRKGQNALLGWDATLPGSGSGAKSLGQELAGSEAFASCQAEKVFRAVCLRAPNDAADRQRVTSMTASFRGGGYRMRQLFADAAVYCMGQ